jgi:protein-S-isoprenylcysteine O-methyltransferase Ste14
VSRLTRSAAALAAAACVNTLSVGAQLRWGTLGRLAGRRAWRLHVALITPGWLLFLCSLPTVRRDPVLRIRRRRRLGLALIGAAGGLWLAAAKQIGGRRVFNADAFGVVAARRTRSGPYRWLRDPIYDSYAVALAGCALFTGNGGYLLLGLESLIVLNILEAAVEARSLEGSRDVIAVAHGLLGRHWRGQLGNMRGYSGLRIERR